MDNLLVSMSWNEEKRATLIRKKEKSTHDGGWNLNPTSIPASTAGLLVGSDRPFKLPNIISRILPESITLRLHCPLVSFDPC
jgi:hypothetical protein